MSLKKDKSQHKKVYIGNIYYNATEQEILEILNIVGPIVEFQAKYDKQTGKQKGFGFCEYPDSELANSSIRNLNGIEFQNRNLKVHYPDKSTKEEQLYEELKNNRKDNPFNDLEFTQQVKDRPVVEVLAHLSRPQKTQVLLEIADLLQTEHQPAFVQMLIDSPKLASTLLAMQKELGIHKLVRRDTVDQPVKKVKLYSGDQLGQMDKKSLVNLVQQLQAQHNTAQPKEQVFLNEEELQSLLSHTPF